MVAKGSQNRLKVLHLGKYAWDSVAAGGIESVIKTCTTDLKQDVNQMVLVFDPSVSGKKTCWENGVTVIRFPVHLAAGYAPVNLFLFFYLRRIIRSFAPDIIHVHMPGLMPFFNLWDLKKSAVIIHWHADVDGSQVSKNIAFPLYEILEQRLLKMADRVIVTSLQYLDASRSLKPFKKKCTVIPIGIPRESAGISSDAPLSSHISRFVQNRPLILSVGRLAYYKGYRFLVQAMAHLQHDKAVLVIAGHGPERDSLEQAVAVYRLQDRVLLPGRISRSDKKALLSRACIFCLPSIDRAEAFGVSLVEAMAYCLPLVTTNIAGSGMNHVNIHNRTGRKVPPGDSRALAHCLDGLLDEPETAKQLGRNSCQRFFDNFQSGKVAARIKKQYSAVLDTTF